MRVIVIGAGLAGLSTACHLVGSGHEVTVVERQDGPGGRGIRRTQDGFAFDTGPTVLTMPGLLADAAAAAGSRLADLIHLERLDPAYRAVYADGSEIRVRHGIEAMRDEIAATCGPDDASAFPRFAEWLRRLHDVEMPHFIDAQFDSPLDLLRSPVAAATLTRLGGFRRLGPVIRSWFRDERLHRLFSFQALYAGLPPDRALALYAVITYMDSIEGVWFPAGGMGQVPAALAAAAERGGAELRYDTSVRRLIRDANGAAAGVELDSAERLRAEAVVCTLDPPTAYRLLLPELRPPRAVRGGRYSPSAVVWHVGARGEPGPGIGHHNIHFGTEWSSAFRALVDDGRLMPSPSRLVTVPTLSEPQLAPAGHSVLYVLEPVPNLTGTVDWRREREPMRERLAIFLAQNGYPTDVVTEHLVTPLDWARDGMHLGTPFALSHTFGQTGPFRPSNLERRVPGLVFAGSGTVPGVGVPIVLISGKLAAARVRAYLPDATPPPRRTVRAPL
ncbi:phytoene dehydrogenase [Intrasporangium chromatireducens Q5-1]|uniref:Phytoene dehydrogenase n=1 Tax=Intrasporangium chromatireducens Q5-1 TaxID=584657 RepID=W9GJ42_9MICO|nr:phytoene desaturase family protein [Intrasporangium chromatireducens]EWT04838.1 phytoene dehydrogenase [Intrasporangium chromatireducens Q5-1]